MAEAIAAPGGSADCSPRSRGGDESPLASSGATRLRLMCSYGGRIVPRPNDRSLRYLGGETRIVVVDRDSSLEELNARLSRTLLGGRAFSLKYQLPNEDLDSLISVSTDEDLDNLVDEYDRVLVAAAAPAGSRPSRIRLFLFPVKPEASPASTIGSLLEDSKSETWFVDALNSAMGGMGIDGVPRGLSAESASVNCLLGLEDDPSAQSHSDAAIAAAGGGAGGGGALSERPEQQLVLPRPDKHARQTQEVQSVPDSPMLDTTSSFGSASSAPSLSSLPPIHLHPEDRPFDLRIAGVDDQFAQTNSAAAGGHRAVDDFKELCVPHTLSAAPLSVSSVSTLTISPTENPARVFSSDDEVFEHGGLQKLLQHPSKPTEVEAPVLDSSLRSTNLNAPADPKWEPVSSAADYQLPSMEQQFQQHLHPQVLRQQQQQQQQQHYFPASPHYMHNPATGGIISVPPYYPIAAHPFQQSPQGHPYSPQIPLYYYPLPPAPSYAMAGVPPGSRDRHLVSSSANTALPPSAASPLQPPLVRPPADQAHYVGMGYHVMQQQHFSQPPATMPNYCYELPLDHSQPQMYPQHQPGSSVAMIADAPADPKS